MAVGTYWGLIQIKEENPVAFHIEVTSNGHTENIDYWEGPDGCIYVFLPGYVAFEDAKFNVSAEEAFINGQELKDGMSCSYFEKDCFYDFYYKSWFKSYTAQIKFMQSANIATMYIDTDSGDLNHIHENKGNEEPGIMALYTADGILDYHGRIAGMNGRGNATWSYEKKPYSVKLDAPANLLHMGEAEKWILLANARDESNLNNKIVYDFADKVGLSFSPDSEWIDLYINNQYRGLYLLCERNEIGESRVNLTTQENIDNYVVSQEIIGRLQAAGYPYVTTAAEIGLRIHEPGNVTGLQMNEIALQFQAAERAIMALDGVDSQTGLHYTEIIDIDSWTRKYIVEEIFMSIDTGFGSQYYYGSIGETDNKIYAGPVWDYDHALAEQKYVAPNAMIANREYVNRYGYTPWYHSLYQHEEFYQNVVFLYETEVREELKALQEVDMAAYLEQLTPSAMMNQVRWSSMTENDFEQSVQNIYTFLEQRMKFLDKVWLDNMQYYTVSVETQEGLFYSYYTIPLGEKITTMPTLPEWEGFRFIGWYNADTDTPFDPTQSIEQDMHIYAKWEPVE